MEGRERIYEVRHANQTRLLIDLITMVALAGVVFIGVRLALNAPINIRGPQISLSPSILPYYAVLSLGRMVAAYILSLVFMLVYGYAAARSTQAEQVLIPLLDVLQSVPILSFLPVVLLSLSAFLPVNVAAELASVVLIFTSQAWNLTFAWYQSLKTIPKELREASTMFRFSSWYRFKTLEFPFAAVSVIWNSMMSWAGGWFFLMAAEIFTVGQRDFRLPGLGTYLRAAADQGNLQALAWGIGVLVLMIVLLDQFFWRPLLAWSDRFKLETVEDDAAPASWFYHFLQSSAVLHWAGERLWHPLGVRVGELMKNDSPAPVTIEEHEENRKISLLSVVLWALSVMLAYLAVQALGMLAGLSLRAWGQIGLGVLATLLRVALALAVALLWTVPVGVAVGTNRRLSTVLQPIIQIAASVPATALFPAFLLLALKLPGGLNLAAVVLMLLGTQWYLLFNVTAGASAIPQDLIYTTDMLQVSRWERWRTLILPALFPYIVTGAITASGGAWNASIVAEYVTFSGHTYAVTGIGALIAQATASGDYPLLLGATLAMIFSVVLINRVLWRRLYRLAEEKYRME